MVIIIIISVALAAMGIVILAGKGDNLIAGYNTASREERAMYDVRKLRLLIGILMFIIAACLCLFELLGDPGKGALAGSFMILVLCIVVVVLANTWAKKK